MHEPLKNQTFFGQDSTIFAILTSNRPQRSLEMVRLTGCSGATHGLGGLKVILFFLLFLTCCDRFLHTP